MLAILNVVMPAFIIMGIGFYIGKHRNPDLAFTADLGVSVLIPCLVLDSIITTDIPLVDLGKIVLYSLLVTFAFVFFTIFVGKYVLHIEEDKLNSFILISSFPNTGNFGLPVALFAFGPLGQAITLICSTAQTILCNTFGIYYASKNNYSMKEALKNVVKTPGFIAVFLAILIKVSGIPLPEMILRPIHLIGQAVVPVLLICLGVQQSRTIPATLKQMLLPSVFGKFVMYPVLAFILLIPFFDPWSTTGRIIILAAFYPTAAAINTFVLKFDPENNAVPTGTLITNVLSVFVLFVVLFFLMPH